jgi:hypothetical protein
VRSSERRQSFTFVWIARRCDYRPTSFGILLREFQTQSAIRSSDYNRTHQFLPSENPICFTLSWM